MTGYHTTAKLAQAAEDVGCICHFNGEVGSEFMWRNPKMGCPVHDVAVQPQPEPVRDLRADVSPELPNDPSDQRPPVAVPVAAGDGSPSQRPFLSGVLGEGPASGPVWRCSFNDAGQIDVAGCGLGLTLSRSLAWGLVFAMMGALLNGGSHVLPDGGQNG